MPHSYVRLDDLKDRAGLNIAGTTENAALRRLFEAVSEQIDDHVHRTFQPFKAVRIFDGNGKTRIPLKWDIARITSLTEDDNLDGAFNTTFGSSDYVTWPYDAASTEDVDWARPVTALEINLKGSGNQDVWLSGKRMYKMTAIFGYAERVRDEGVRTTGSSFTAASTSFLASNSTRVSVGDTVLVGSEQMYVVHRTSSEVHVDRAVNGTTAAVHASSAVVSRFIYPGAIAQAALMQVSRLWTRRESGYSDNAIGLQESGQAGPMVTGMDADVRQLISKYKRPVA
jgi:hypothetical protein